MIRSSPRKRGPRIVNSEPVALDSRLRGNERAKSVIPRGRYASIAPRTEHRAVGQRAHAARSRGPRRAAGHHARPDDGASLRDVLAPAALRRVRRLGNVDVLAAHRDLAW